MKVRMTASEFANYVSAFMYDKLSNPELVVPYTNNPEFDDLCEVLKRKGVRQVYLLYWLHMTPQQRMKYRITRDIFRPLKKGTPLQIEIIPDPIVIPPEQQKGGIVKKIGKLLKKFIGGGFSEEKPKDTFGG